MDRFLVLLIVFTILFFPLSVGIYGAALIIVFNLLFGIVSLCQVVIDKLSPQHHASPGKE